MLRMFCACRYCGAAVLCALLLASDLLAAQPAAPPADNAPPGLVPELPETVVQPPDEAPESAPEPADFPPAPDLSDFDLDDFDTGPKWTRDSDLLGETTSASQGVFGQPDLEYRPMSRAGEVLELVPGLIATQHSGTGKANQYFVRGFNLDHGTDFALRVDGVPINLPSHGHGQGYLDVNWLIPELIEYGEYKLGPYYADVGDFSSAGALDLRLMRSLPQGFASVTAGSYDYYRVLVADSYEARGGELLVAYESVFYDGPWTTPEDFNKYNGIIRYSVGHDCHGMAFSALAYRSNWTATNQIPQRAVDAGIIGRFGTLDPTDGGKTTRVGLNWEYWRETDCGTTRANAYSTYYDLDLFSNFTFFLDDPVNGDQIEQVDNRIYSGFNLSHQLPTRYGSQTLGYQFRNDSIWELALNHTRQRQLVNNVRRDDVDQQSHSIYYINEAQLAERLRSYVGLRGDFYRFHDRSDSSPVDSGTVQDAIFSPKLGLVAGPWCGTELFLNWGQSFHSNDARGVNSATDPAAPLVKSDGSEIGVRSWITPEWNSTLTFWYLELDSELLFVGDVGTTEPSLGSHRFGVTTTNHWHVRDWLTLDADYAYVRPRFAGGERIPGAVENVLSTGFTAKDPCGPWYLTFRIRHYGPSALTEDNSVRNSTTTLANLQVGYQTERMRLSCDLFNLFDRQDNDIAYYYPTAPMGLPAQDDFLFHPVEPFMARAQLMVMW